MDLAHPFKNDGLGSSEPKRRARESRHKTAINKSLHIMQLQLRDEWYQVAENTVKMRVGPAIALQAACRKIIPKGP
jgi:hypothetical protein